MNSILYAALATGFTFMMTAIGAAVVFFFRRPSSGGTKRIYLGFAAGVMIAATIWSLIIPAIDRAQEMNVLGWLPATGGIVIGTLFLLGLEILMERLRCAGRMPGKLMKTSHSTSLLLMAVTLHNIPEGMAVGLSVALAAQSGNPAMLLGAISLALGIGIQNMPEGAAISLPLRDEGMSRPKAFLIGALSAIVEPIFGILTVFIVTIAQPMMPWLLAFAAGAMLFVSVRELIPEACCQDRNYIGTLSVLVGFLIMMILDVALG
jgi:ZIP family zinc transporter